MADLCVHGTNKPDGVGRRVSRGCIRLYPEHIKRLFSAVAVGTKVTVVDQWIKMGWKDGELYLELFPTGDEIDELEETGKFRAAPISDLLSLVREKAGAAASRLDLDAVDLANRERLGIPVRITR